MISAEGSSHLPLGEVGWKLFSIYRQPRELAAWQVGKINPRWVEQVVLIDLYHCLFQIVTMIDNFFCRLTQPNSTCLALCQG